MTDSAFHPAPARHRVALTALWAGLFGTALAWTLQELIAYAVLSHACYPSWQPYRVPRPAGTWGVAAGLAIALLVLGGAGLATAYRSWDRTRPAHQDAVHHQAEVGEGRARFMALGGLLVSGMILFGMIMNVIVLFLIDPCG